MIDIRHRAVTANGTRLHLAESGPADGPCIILCHGFPESWYSWRHQLKALGEAGYHVVAPDMRGFGRSSHLLRFRHSPSQSLLAIWSASSLRFRTGRR